MSLLGQRVSNYTLVEQLGEGAYGGVWRGVHVHDSHFEVAVKLVTGDLRRDPKFVDALRRECRSLDRLDHPGIVRFRELVIEGELVAMVMELLRGGDLEGLLSQGPQPVDEVQRLLEATLGGLAYAHGAGLLHRDIKPANIYRCLDGRVKLLDFGIARAADGTGGTRTGTLKGTLDYMAPERFSAGGGGPASDVYALGLVMWELLAGCRACVGAELPQKLGWHLGVGASDVRLARPDCPAWLAELLSSMTAREVADRPVDGAAALRHFQRAHPWPPEAWPGVAPAPSPQRLQGPSTVSLPPSGDLAEPPLVRPLGGGGIQTEFEEPWLDGPAFGTTSGVLGPSDPIVSEPALAAAPTPSPQPAGPSVGGAATRGAGIGWWALGVSLLLVGGGATVWRSEDERPSAPTAAAASAAGASRLPAYELKPVPAGAYTIGCNSGRGRSCERDETKRKVTMRRAILVGTTEVTQGLYAALMGSNPSWSSNCGLGCPVETVSWFDAVSFANKLSDSEGLEPCYVIRGETVTWPKGSACLGYRLPTESEWEVAARGGADSLYSGGSSASSVAWTSENSGNQTHAVGQKAANGYGLYDMSGNVWEWTWDWYAPRPVAGTDPTGPASGSDRATRGGCWYLDPLSARVVSRGGSAPGNRSFSLGFRLVRTAG